MFLENAVFEPRSFMFWTPSTCYFVHFFGLAVCCLTCAPQLRSPPLEFPQVTMLRWLP